MSRRSFSLPFFFWNGRSFRMKRSGIRNLPFCNDYFLTTPKDFLEQNLYATFIIFIFLFGKNKVLLTLGNQNEMYSNSWEN